MRFAFGDTIDDVTSRRRETAGVVSLAFPAAARTSVVTPVRNERGLVHSLWIRVEAPPPPGEGTPARF